MPETIVQFSMPPCDCRDCRRARGAASVIERTYDVNGFDENGYDANGFNVFGYDTAGYDADGYDERGYDASGYGPDGYDENGVTDTGRYRYSCDSCSSYYCGGCEPEYEDGRDALQSYSYTPRLKFRGDAGPFYGMEIEVTSDRIRDLVDIVNDRAPYELIYCKADSSVDGAELVTHPMSYEWAMEHFPWDLLPALRDGADATIIPQENGIHVHVGRDGFADSAHMYRWLKLWYRNPGDIQRIARRRSNEWGSFQPEHREAQKEHVKRDKRGYCRGNDHTLYSRYAAINTTNDATLEVRVFASTLRPQRAKAALQLVAASVEYTRILNCDAITHRHGWDWRAFMAWTAKSGQYPDLIAENRVRRSL